MSSSFRSRFVRRIGLIFLLASRLVPGAGAALIDFESLGTPAGPEVTSQFGALGVTFNSPRAFDYQGRFPPVQVHSGTRAIEQCFAIEFCQQPIRVTFTAGQSLVRVWVGTTFGPGGDQPILVLLNGYNAAGTLIASDSVALPIQNNPVPVQHPLEIGSFRRDIVRVDVTTNSGFMNGIVVDDVEFNVVGPPPPCPATTPPTLTVLTQTSTTQTNRFLYRDQAGSGDPGAQRTITVTGPAAGQVATMTNSVASRPSMITWLYGMLFPGLNTVTTRISDCKGSITRTFNVTYNQIPVGTRVQAVAWEITQSIQNTQMSVPLIAQKRTFLRLYLRSSGPTIPGITGVINAFPPGADPTWQHGPAVAPYNLKSLNTITVDDNDNLLTKRSNMDGGLLFELPVSWTMPGRLNFVLTNLYVDGDQAPVIVDDPARMNDLGHFQYVTFYLSPPISVHVVDVPYHMRGAPGTVFTPRKKDHDNLKSWLERAYPVPNVFMSFGTTGTLPFGPDELVSPALSQSPRFKASFVNAILNQMREMDRSTRPVSEMERYYGMVDDGGKFMRGQADSIPSKIASGPSGSSSWNWDTDGSYADWYGGHELGHTYGRTHAEFCGAVACPEIISFLCPGGFQGYPYPGGKISGGPLDLEFGFDVGDASLGIKKAVYSPSLYTDIMTYCDFEWMSDFTYLRILDRIRSEHGITGFERTEAGVTGVILTGVLNLTQNTGMILPSWKLDEVLLSERPPSSPFHIVFRDAGGAVLADYPFLPKVDTELQAGEDINATLAEVLPWVPGTRRIEVRRDTLEITFVTVSANPPLVRVLTPNGGENYGGASSVTVQWQAFDIDGDNVTAAVQYSSDNGVTWRTLASNLTGSFYDAPIALLPGSTTARMRVVASDGLNTAMDASDAVFTVPGHAPEATLKSPETGEAFTSSQTVVFTGEGNDVEDGPLEGTALAWSSSLQGALGTGRSISAPLRPGTHVVTLQARDSANQTGQASVTVTVTADAPIPDPGPSRLVLLGQPTVLDASASQGIGPLTYQWDLILRPAGSAAALAQPDQAATSLTPDLTGVYVLQLTVTDATGASAMARVALTATTAGNALRIAGGLQSATPADLVTLNVETGAPTANRIDLLDVVRLLQRAAAPRQGSGSVVSSSSNRYLNTGVYIDNPALNGVPDVPVLAQHRYTNGITHPHPLGVLYHAAAGKWVIYNEDGAPMPDGLTFFYAYGAPITTMARSAANAPFAWGVTLQDGTIAGDPNAVVLAGHGRVTAENPSPLGVWFSGTDWVAFNESGAPMVNGERFFYVNATGSGGSVVHSAATSFGGQGVYLDDPRLNNNPNAIVLAQHSGQNQYNVTPMALTYSLVVNKWAAFNEDLSPFPMDEVVNYFIAKQ